MWDHRGGVKAKLASGSSIFHRRGRGLSEGTLAVIVNLVNVSLYTHLIPRLHATLSICLCLVGESGMLCIRANLDGSRAVQPPGRTPGELYALVLIK